MRPSRPGPVRMISAFRRYLDTWHKGTEGWKIMTREIVAAGAVGRDESTLTMMQRLTLSDGH